MRGKKLYSSDTYLSLNITAHFNHSHLIWPKLQLLVCSYQNSLEKWSLPMDECFDPEMKSLTFSEVFSTFLRPWESSSPERQISLYGQAHSFGMNSMLPASIPLCCLSKQHLSFQIGSMIPVSWDRHPTMCSPLTRPNHSVCQLETQPQAE